MFCLKCGAEIPNVSSFCLRCGTALDAISGVTGASRAALSANEPQRVEVEPGDLLLVPANRYHRFLLTDARHIRCVRLYKDESGWVPVYRSVEGGAERSDESRRAEVRSEV